MLLLGDCLEEMRKIESGSVDMVMCDLPYGTTQNKWDSIIPLSLLWEQYFRVCNGVIALTATQPFSSSLVMSQPDSFRYEWVWVKTKITGVLNAKRMPVRKHEQILIFQKSGNTIYNAQGLLPHGKKRIDQIKHSSNSYGKRGGKEYTQDFTNWPRDVLEIPSEGKTVHPTQKPVALLEYLIRTYTNKGDTVLDNTMGSGSTGVACANTGRKFIGIEKDPTYFAIAERRIAEAQSLAQAAE